MYFWNRDYSGNDLCHEWLGFQSRSLATLRYFRGNGERNDWVAKLVPYSKKVRIILDNLKGAVYKVPLECEDG